MKKAGIVLGLLAVMSLASCARRACPAYDGASIQKTKITSVRTV